MHFALPGPRFAMVPERFPSAELPTENGSVVPHFPGLVWDMGALPLSFAPVSPTTPSGPLDLSSPFSSSGSSSGGSSGDEDEGRTSDPPSPDPMERFQCAHCGKTCSSPTALSRHQLSHCGRTAESVITPAAITTAATTVPPTGRSSFHCKHCPKEYTSLGALKMHIRSHTLPCVCTTCGKAFSRPWLLRGHIRTHTGKDKHHTSYLRFKKCVHTTCISNTFYCFL